MKKLILETRKEGVLNSMKIIVVILFVAILGILIMRMSSGKAKKGNKTKVSGIDKAIDFALDKEEEEVILTMKEQKQRDLEIKIIRSGLPIKPKEYQLFKWGMVVIVFLLFGVLAGNIFLGLIFGGAMLFIPPLLLNHAIEKKRLVFENQIPIALSLIRNSVEAGFSFMQAIEVVATEMDAPISEEFSRVLHEASVGKDIEVALNNMQERILSDELKLVVVAVLIQRQVGGNLGEIIESILETINDRIQIKGEIRTMTSQGRFSAIIICALPIGLGAIMYFMNPEYMSPLFTTTMGQVLLGVAAIMIGLGAFLISKIVKIDF